VQYFVKIDICFPAKQMMFYMCDGVLYVYLGFSLSIPDPFSQSRDSGLGDF